MRHPPLKIGILSVVVAVGYVAGLGWTMYGMQPLWPFWTWVLIGVGAPLLWLVIVDERSRSHWVAGLLVGLGVGLTILGWIGSGVVSDLSAYGGEDVYYGITYDWASNTLRFGETMPEANYPAHVHPNRSLLAGSTLLIVLGISLGLMDRTADAESAPPESTGAQ